jgi:chromosomal replication initiator protein
MPITSPLLDPRTNELRDHLRTAIGPHRMGMWFGEGTAIGIADRTIEVVAGSPYAAEWIDRHFASTLRAVAARMLGEGAGVRVASRDSDSSILDADGQALDPARRTPSARSAEPNRRPDEGAPPRAIQRSGSTAVRERGEDAQRQDRLRVDLAGSTAPLPQRAPGSRHSGAAPSLRRLESFVVGPSNRLAFSAAERLADDLDRTAGLLFLHGECGVGKTHLMQGICSRRRERDPRQRVRCLSGEQFTNEFIAAVRGGGIEEFRRRHRKIDLLAIDDVHFLANKSATQAEFLHTLDAIGLGGATVVLASDEHPRSIARFSRALTSRFLAGMVVGIEPPDRQTRVALLQRLAAQRGLLLGPAAVEAIVGRFLGSARELEGAVAKLAALAMLEGSPPRGGEIGMVLVDRLLEQELGARGRAPIGIASIVAATVAELGIEREELLGAGRRRPAVEARGVVVHLARRLTSMSYPEIARSLGRRNHSSIHAAEARIRAAIAGEKVAPETAEALKERIDRISHRLLAGR